MGLSKAWRHSLVSKTDGGECESAARRDQSTPTLPSDSHLNGVEQGYDGHKLSLSSAKITRQVVRGEALGSKWAWIQDLHTARMVFKEVCYVINLRCRFKNNRVLGVDY